MLRTNKEWYNLQTVEVRQKMNKNCNDINRWIRDTEKRSLWDAISNCFYWHRTPEKHEYWSKIANQKL